MDINTIKTNTSIAQAANSNPGNASLGQTEFLQLLTTQLQNQDPLNPMNSAEYAAQLAQFSSVEQLVNLNQSMESMIYNQQLMNTGLNNSMSASLAGKEVTALSDAIFIGEDRSSDVTFRLNSIASEVEVNILDSNGNVVRTETLGSFSKGDHSWTWDGLSDSGRNVPQGTYRVEINAINGETPVNALTFMKGEVSSVKYTSNGVELIVNGVAIPLGDIEAIGA